MHAFWLLTIIDDDILGKLGMRFAKILMPGLLTAPEEKLQLYISQGLWDLRPHGPPLTFTAEHSPQRFRKITLVSAHGVTSFNCSGLR